MLPPRLLCLSLMACPSAVAAATMDESWCRNGMFTVQNSPVGLGRVAAGERAHFLNDIQGCPGPDSKCRLKSYLVAGDSVVTGRTLGKYICIYYLDKEGGIAGWVDASLIRPLTVRNDPPLSAWIGRWSDYGNPVVRF